MTQKAPGKFERDGISLLELMQMFPDNEIFLKWLEEIIWPDGPACPYCGSKNVQSNINHKSMTHRCRDCKSKPRFSIKTGTVMQSSKLSYQTWALAIYMLTTNIKGVSSMRLHRELKITQKSAWHLLHRLRKSYETGEIKFSGPVEVDETYMGGKERNKHESKKLNAGRGAVGKTAVVGMKDRKTNEVVAKTVDNVKKPTLHEFVEENTEEGTEIYTDENKAYEGLKNHKAVKHSVGEYVIGNVHTNGVESFWAMFKRGHKGIYHKMSKKHLDRYVKEFVGRHNQRPQGTVNQMIGLASGMVGKRLRYSDLIADNGLDSGARSI